MQRLTDTLSRDVHVPINQWHKRYGELKESVVKELDVARKHYDAASQDLNKTKARLLPPPLSAGGPAGCCACLSPALPASPAAWRPENRRTGSYR